MESLTPAGRRILEAASELFYSVGIHAVGVEGIAKAAGVTKKTLYDCFGSKEWLVAAYLTDRDERWRTFLTERIDRVADPADRPLATLDVLAEWMPSTRPRGCAFVNALAELPGDDELGRSAVRAQKRWMLDYLTDLATAAGIADSSGYAEALMLLHEGAAVSAPTSAVPDAIATAKTIARRLAEVPARPVGH